MRGLYRAMWYDSPGEDWESGLPLGNGRLGAMVFGGVAHDQVLLNEKTVWAGGPAPKMPPDTVQRLEQLRQMLFDGEYARAERYCQEEFMVDDTVEARYQPLGSLRMDFDLPGEARNYRRELDIGRALATVTFELDGVVHRREAFVSPVDDVIVVRLNAGRPGRISGRFTLNRPADFQCRAGGEGVLRLWGRPEEGGVGFEAWLKVLAEGGSVRTQDTGIRVDGADAVTLFVAAATDYNLAEPTEPLSEDLGAACREVLEAVASRPCERLVEDHVREHRRLFDRVALEIDLPPGLDLPMDRRVARVKGGKSDPELLLYDFHYCRYILISSSRPGTLPSNLLGVWNPLLEPPWHGHYQYNVNSQENYWIAESLNLSECHEPWFALNEALLPSGRETARALGCGGWVAGGAYTTAWLATIPQGVTAWGMWFVAGGWNLLHFMEHYRFTRDEEFLRERAYPLLAESCRFFLDWLVEDPETGELISGPSTSPENRFLDEEGNRCCVTMGCSCDQEIIRDTFTNLLEAAELLDIESALTAEVENALDRLALSRVGSDGRLMEWRREFTEAEPGHRHVSHLYGFMPGDRITLSKTPDLVEAVRKSVDRRLASNYHAQGWSLGWVISILVRLREGDRALGLIEDSYFPKFYPNLFIDAHGRVQVGDMMGVPAAMAEMLVQSHDGEIHLLPALPAAWGSGRLRGFCARGAFTVDIEWRDGRLTSAAVRSQKGGECRLRYGDEVRTLKTEPGCDYAVTF